MPKYSVVEAPIDVTILVILFGRMSRKVSEAVLGWIKERLTVMLQFYFLRNLGLLGEG